MEHTHEGHEHHAEHVVQTTTKLADFIPLALVFLAVIVFTVVATAFVGTFDLVTLMRHFMAGFFLIFGAFKIINWRGFADAYSIYDVIAKRSRFYAYLYPLIELGLGAAYLFAISLVITNVVTVVIMSVGAIGVAGELLKKNEIPCACLGVVFKIPMTKVTLVEDLLMAGMALWMLFLLI